MIEGRSTGVGHQVADGRILYAVSYIKFVNWQGKKVPFPVPQFEYLHAQNREEALFFFKNYMAKQARTVQIIDAAPAVNRFVEDEHGDNGSMDAPDQILI